MAKRNRYSLVYEGDNGKKLYFETRTSYEKNIRKKFSLTKIDAFTTRLNSEDDLKLIFEHLSKEKLEDGKFYIEYVQNKKKKKLRIAYKEDDIIAYFANNNIDKTYVEENTKYETYIINLLYKLMTDSKLYEYLLNNKSINNYTLGKIRQYIYAKENGNEELITYTFNKVKKSVLNYRVIRNIEDGINEYNKKKTRTEEKANYDGQYKLF